MISATHLARSLVRQLIELGVSDFVLSPGSRNAPISIALEYAHAKGLIDLHVRIDERGAAFYALGISKASNKYVALVCTSGTAAANYYPAALEALHSHEKILFITADRPERLRKTGANQTTDQVDMYSNIPCHDISAQIDLAKVLTEGPIQLNVQFDEPLLPSDDVDWLAGLNPHIPKEIALPKTEAIFSGNGVVIVGHDRGGFSSAAVSQFCETLGWPVVAEDPLSFPQGIAHAAIFLADESVRALLHPSCVVVIGRTTLSRSTNSYIQNATNVVIIDPRIEFLDSARQAEQIYFSLPAVNLISPATSDWMQLWNSISQQTGEALNASMQWSEQEAISTIAKLLPDSSALFVGSSRPIRDLEGFSTPRSGINVYANRGLAGIDGNISTVFGIASQYEHTYAILGDITFLHDISALVNLPKINLTIFVIDNNGGGIFSTLPQSGVAGFDKIFGTPHDHDLAKVARGFGLPAERIKSSSDLAHIISHQDQGIEVVVIEVPSREENASNLKAIFQSVSSAVRMGNNLD